MKLGENINNQNLFNPRKFQASILKKSRENHVFPKKFQTDISNYRIALLQKMYDNDKETGG